MNVRDFHADRGVTCVLGIVGSVDRLRIVEYDVSEVGSYPGVLV